MLGMSLLMGARGVGALLGPLIGRPLGRRPPRRACAPASCSASCSAAAGYMLPGLAPHRSRIAMLAVVVAHAGSSTNWVFSTTLLQIYTEDRFRGRVFAADFGICMLTISVSSYLAGVALDLGVPPRTFAIAIGCDADPRRGMGRRAPSHPALLNRTALAREFLLQ